MGSRSGNALDSIREVLISNPGRDFFMLLPISTRKMAGWYEGESVNR
jgi:hypothetical protein